MTKLETYLKEIKDRCGSATLGPWKHEVIGENQIISGLGVCSNFTGPDNSKFIAHARTDVELLHEIVGRLLDKYVDDYGRAPAWIEALIPGGEK